MYKLKAQNEFGELINLTQNQNYTLKSVTGLTPPSATINTTSVTNFDGARYNSSKMTTRNIVLNILPNSPIEENRINLYRYFKVKRFVRVYYENSMRKCEIEGYVETVEGNLFENRQQLQISIICPSPYFKSRISEEETIDTIVDQFTLPFVIPKEGVVFSSITDTPTVQIYNSGDVETGIEILAVFNGKVDTINIFDITKTQKMSIEYDFIDSDVLQINTERGQKSITLQRNETVINLINYLTKDSTWLTLSEGENQYTYTALYGAYNLTMDIRHMDLYEGV